MCDEVYVDRNLLALAFAKLAHEAGWKVGWSTDTETPDWRLLYVETPAGQVSWHLPASMLEQTTLPTHSLPWDGHDVAEKRRRLGEWLKETFPHGMAEA